MRQEQPRSLYRRVRDGGTPHDEPTRRLVLAAGMDLGVALIETHTRFFSLPRRRAVV